MAHEFLIKKLNDSGYSEKEIQDIICGLFKKKYTTIRINRLKADETIIDSFLKDNNIRYEKKEDFKDAYILNDFIVENGKNIDIESKVVLEDLSIYKEGKIYVQNLSSMLPVYIVEPHNGENILDMCASPGSKATMIQSITYNKSNLTAIELHKDRFERLKHNIYIQGANIYAINQNAFLLDDNLKFDKVLLDAPCSGSGTLFVGYEKYFTDTLIDRCIKTQMKLIKKASKLLNKGKTLVYSTCSLLKVENEDMVDFAIKNGFELSYAKKVLPDEYFEGFFVAKLIKR